MGRRLSQPQILMLSPAGSSCIGSPRFAFMLVCKSHSALSGGNGGFLPHRSASPLLKHELTPSIPVLPLYLVPAEASVLGRW